MGSQTVSVTVDSREQKAGYHVAFDANEYVCNVNVEQIPIGDFVLDDEIVFERKTPSDFVKSLKNNRLESQVRRMTDEYGASQTYLVIQGTLKDIHTLERSGFDNRAINGFISSMSARWSTPPLFLDNRYEVTDMVVRIGRKHSEETDRVVVKPDDTPEWSDADFFERALMQLHGIGPVTAERIYDEFDSLPEFVSTDTDRMTKIQRVGDKRADNILTQVRDAGSEDD